MKNINPLSGLRQVATGKLYLPRRPILEMVRSKKMNPSTLGYFIISLISADWSDGKYRYGIIRHEVKKLATIWNIPYSTLLENLNKLCAIQVLSKNDDLFSIIGFDDFQKPGGQYSNQNSISDEILEQIFRISLLESEITNSNQIKADSSLKIPLRDEFNSIGDPDKSAAKSMSDYERIYQSDDYQGFLPEDMKWVDDHYAADGSYIP